jgi:hypothetical protein
MFKPFYKLGKNFCFGHVIQLLIMFFKNEGMSMSDKTNVVEHN